MVLPSSFGLGSNSHKNVALEGLEDISVSLEEDITITGGATDPTCHIEITEKLKVDFEKIKVKSDLGTTKHAYSTPISPTSKLTSIKIRPSKTKPSEVPVENLKILPPKPRVKFLRIG